jgi:hypothetical protein
LVLIGCGPYCPPQLTGGHEAARLDGVIHRYVFSRIETF